MRHGWYIKGLTFELGNRHSKEIPAMTDQQRARWGAHVPGEDELALKAAGWAVEFTWDQRGWHAVALRDGKAFRSMGFRTDLEAAHDLREWLRLETEDAAL